MGLFDLIDVPSPGQALHFRASPVVLLHGGEARCTICAAGVHGPCVVVDTFAGTEFVIRQTICRACAANCEAGARP